MSNADRVSYSASRKVYDKKLGSFEVGFTYSTSVGAGETPSEAANRAFKFVDRAVEHKLGKVLREIADDGLSEENIDKRLDRAAQREAEG